MTSRNTILILRLMSVAAVAGCSQPERSKVYNVARGIATDDNRNAYIVGLTNGTFPNSHNYGGYDLFVVKYDITGTVKWIRQLGTAGDDNGEGIATDGSGNIYITGVTNGSFPSFSNAGGDNNIFIIKLNNDGEQQWIYQLGATNGGAGASAVAMDSSGNIYVTGGTDGNLPGFTNAGGADLFVMKLNSEGELQWIQQMGTASGDSAWGVATNSGSGDVYITGHTIGDFPGFTNKGASDLFVMKLDSSGTQQWTQQLGTAGVEQGTGIATDRSGNVYIAGYTDKAFPSFSNMGDVDLVIIKLNSNGEQLWINQLGTAKSESPTGIATDRSGDIYISGSTSGSFPGFSNAGEERDMFLIKLNTNSALQWTRQVGTNMSDHGTGVATDGAYDVYVSGDTAGSYPGSSISALTDLTVTLFNAGGGEQQWTKQLGAH